MTRRKILVTGSSRGIGRAAVAAFAAAGEKVAVHHRDSARLAAEVLAGLPGDGHVVVQGGPWWTARPTSLAGWTCW